MKIEDIKIGERVRKDMGDIGALADSISKIGLIHPITILEDRTLSTGYRRLLALKKLGVTELKDDDCKVFPLNVEPDENLMRKEFTISERIEALRIIEGREKKKARERSGARTDLRANLPTGSFGRASEKVAKIGGFGSRRTYEKAKAVLESGDQELIDWMDEIDSVDIAYNIRKVPDKRARRHLIEQVKKKEWRKKKVSEAVGKILRPGIDLSSEEDRRRILGEIPIQLTTCWRNMPHMDGIGKREFPGSLPAGIVANLLHHFTKERDRVCDPFCGGGTTIDVCKLMNRQWQRMMFDLTPVREDIIQNDSSKQIPLADNSVNLILLDPPYGLGQRHKWSEQPGDLGNLKIEEYYEAIRQVAIECKRILAEQGITAFVVGNYESKRGFEDIAFGCLNIFREQGFYERQRFCDPLPMGTTGRPITLRLYTAEKSNTFVTGFREILVFGSADAS